MAKAGTYPAKKRETLVEAPGLRVRHLELETDQCVPWHTHTEITDTFVVLAGPLIVETRDPDAAHRLETGDILPIPAGQPHYVHGDNGPCRFLALQGGGTYDYVPVSEDD